MEGYRVIVTPRAGRDIEGIYDYIAQDSPENAAKMVARIFQALDSLVQFPHRTLSERQSAKLAHPVRSVPVRPYVIYFRVLDHEKVVRVLHVRHGARRRPKRLE